MCFLSAALGTIALKSTGHKQIKNNTNVDNLKLCSGSNAGPFNDGFFNALNRSTKKEGGYYVQRIQKDAAALTYSRLYLGNRLRKIIKATSQ